MMNGGRMNGVSEAGCPESTILNSESALLTEERLAGQLLNELNNYRLECKFTDATLCVNQEELPCHRNVLAASSPYFDSMFSSAMQEGLQALVNFDSVSPWVMRRLLDYIYTGRLEIRLQHAQDYVKAGHLLHYPAVVETAANLLLHNLYSCNAAGLREFARLYGCSNLEEGAEKFVRENFVSVSESNEFCDLPLGALKEYLLDDRLEVPDEEVVVQAVLRWCQHSIDRRCHDLPDLLTCVRLGALSQSFIAKLRTDSLLRNSLKCQRILDCFTSVGSESDSCNGNGSGSETDSDCSNQNGHMNGNVSPDLLMNGSSDYGPPKMEPRPSTLERDMLVLITDGEMIKRPLCVFDPEKNRWRQVSRTPSTVTSGSWASSSKDLYLCGGIIDNQLTDTAWHFSVKSMRWVELPPMPLPRAKHASIVYKNKLYVLGGITLTEDGDLEPVKDVYAFCLVSGEWSMAGFIPLPRLGSQTLIYEDIVYEVGGLTEDGFARTIALHEIDTCGEMRSSGEHLVLPGGDNAESVKATFVDDTLYVMWDNSKQMIALNPQTQIFKRLPLSVYSHAKSSLISLGHSLYITGGLVDGKPALLGEQYDTATGQWTQFPMLEELSAHTSLIINL